MTHSIHLKVIALCVSWACLLTACATAPVSAPPPVEDAGSRAPVERVPTEAPASAGNTSSAANTLLAQASEAAASSEHGTAIVYLERAIRLEPRNPQLWIALARQYLATNDTPKATQYARKAIALAGTDEASVRDAWLTLADIKEEEGAIYEAQSIRRRYETARG